MDLHPPPGRSLEGEGQVTIEERACKIAHGCIIPCASPYFVALTQYQQERVIKACMENVAIELREMLAEYNIKFDE